MYQLNKKQTLALLNCGKVTFLYKLPAVNVLVTIYRDQILPNGTIRVPIKTQKKSFRLLVTIPYFSQLVTN
jgi:hypothetical protein